MTEPKALMLGCTLKPILQGVLESWHTYAFGPYYPKSWTQHWDSSWSQMVLKVKHHDKWTTDVVGHLLAAYLDCWLCMHTDYVATCVPAKSPIISNAAAELTAAIVRHINSRKIRSTSRLLTPAGTKRKSQHRCHGLEERRENVRGLYRVKEPEIVKGKTVIVIDDIITTGATMRECLSTLKKAGATNVIGIAMARTVGQMHFGL